ncbi:MAG TPA: hypothetical protein VKY92_08925 [Verrucomicrobiae bacterium]|nr:hypothetical protein [Verrucomicrobiae bacterium]
MGAIDFLLNIAGLLLWLGWRSSGFDPLVKSTPVTLVGTLKRPEPRRIKGWQLAILMLLLLAVRAWLYEFIGGPAEWTPRLNLELVVLAFRNNAFAPVALFSCLSFVRTMVVFYFWLLVLASINQTRVEPDPILRLVRLNLGRFANWPWPLQWLIPMLTVLGLWLAVYPLLVRCGVMTPATSTAHMVEQGLLVTLGLVLSLKLVLAPLLLLHLVANYVYLGSNPVWEFVTGTAQQLTAPLRRLPLHWARLDLAPVIAVLLVLGTLQWLPNLILSRLTAANVSIWPL